MNHIRRVRIEESDLKRGTGTRYSCSEGCAILTDGLSDMICLSGEGAGESGCYYPSKTVLVEQLDLVARGRPERYGCDIALVRDRR